MTIPTPRLDDLTWDALTEAARRAIPAESDGRWTLHAPVDPGVTVLELFAYLLEQRLFQLDQVPDELVVAVLRLLGLPPPLPARPAATVLRFDAAEPAVVPAGTAVSRDPQERIVFTLAEDVAVVPLAADGPRLTASGLDRTADLRAGRGVPLLPAGGGPGEFRVVLRPAPDSSRPPRGTWLSLLFELDAPAQCPPSWSPDAVAEVPPPAVLSWTWFDPATGTPAGTAEAADGTAGLRRSGVVRLRLPAAWCGAGDPVDGYGLLVGTRAATYPAPPVLRQLAANVGPARHREVRTVTEAELADQVASWLRLPDQRLTLPEARGLLLEASLRLRRGGEPQKWTAAPALTFGGPTDRIFLLDRDAGELRFGDGLTGAIPVPDPVGAGPEPVVRVRYARGGGAAGNGGRTANWFVVRPPQGAPALAIGNVVPAEGGREPETVAEARRRAGEELGRAHRAVTAADAVALALGTPGVAVGRAHAGVGEHPAYPCTVVPGAMTVRVVPRVVRGAEEFAAGEFTAAVQPDPGLLRAVRAHLERARLLGSELFVCPPRYRRVRVRVDLAGHPADPAQVRAALRAALRRYLDPLAGGDDGQGWPFGGPLRPSALLRVAQAALGDTAEVTGVAIGLDGVEPTVDCADVPLRPGELAALESVATRGAA